METAEGGQEHPKQFDYYLVAEATSTLFVASAFLAGFTLWKRGISGLSFYAVSLSIPALASMILLLLGALIPSLFATRRIGFPLNFTLPLIHASMIAAIAELIRTGVGLIRLPGPLEAAMIWSDVRMVIASFFAQCAVFSVLALMRPVPQAESGSR